MVIHDHEGRVVAALSKRPHYPLRPLEVEAKAMEEAVELAWDVGSWDAHFKSDSLILFNAIQGLCSPLVAISNVVTGICHRLQVFRSMVVSHVRRRGNKPAQILAQYAKSISSFFNLGRR